MSSPFAQIFKSLRTRISTLADGETNLYFRHVDQDLGQLEHHTGDNRPPVAWPCVLIDVAAFKFSELSYNSQSGEGVIKIRIGFPPFSASGANTPATYSDKALYYYELEQVLHLALEGWHPGTLEDFEALADICTPLTRVTAQTEERTDFIRVREITYTIGITDTSTKPGTQFTPATMALTTELNT